MATVEFLRFQDKNNDGLQDICGPQDIIEIEKCPACIIKPTALLPGGKIEVNLSF